MQKILLVISFISLNASEITDAISKEIEKGVELINAPETFEASKQNCSRLLYAYAFHMGTAAATLGSNPRLSKQQWISKKYLFEYLFKQCSTKNNPVQ